MLLIIIILIVTNIFKLEPFVLKPSNKITLDKIQNRIKFLIKKINVNPDKINRKDFNKILDRYNYLCPTNFNRNMLFNKLDIYQTKLLNWKTITFLYFYNNKTLIDNNIYKWNYNLKQLVKNNKLSTTIIPSNISHNYQYFIKSIKTNKNIEPLNKFPIIPLNNNPNSKLQIYKKGKCSRPYEVCHGYNNLVKYYGINNINVSN